MAARLRSGPQEGMMPVPEFDITRPLAEQDSALAVLVLRLFAEGKGPLTAGDAARIVGVFDNLYDQATTSARALEALKDIASRANAHIAHIGEPE